MTRRRHDAGDPPQLFEPELVAVAPPAPEPITQTLPVVASQAIRELLGFPARFISSLPLATTLRCVRVSQARRSITVTTSRSAYEASRAVGLPTFNGGELAALALAAEHERASPEVFERWCETKASDPAWKLTAETAVGGAVGRFEPLGWPLGQVLRRYGLELHAVGIGDETLEGGP